MLVLAPHVPRTVDEAAPWHLFQELRALAARGVALCVASTVDAEPFAEGVEMVRLRPESLRKRPLCALPRAARSTWTLRRWWPERGGLPPRRLLRWTGWQRAVVELARRWQPDVIHSHWAFPSGSGGVAAARLLRIPSIMTLRGSDHLVTPLDPRGDCHDRSYEAALRSALQHTSCVTVCCTDSLSRLRELGFRDSRRTRLFRHAIEFDRFQSPDHQVASLRQRLGLRNEPVVLCVAGMHDPRKGHETLLEAFAQLAAADSALRLVLVGNGPFRHKLESQATALGIANRTIFAGRAHPTEIPTYFRMATVSVLPTLIEAFGNVVFESLAVGTPVVASSLGTPKDLLPRGPYGLLVPPGDVDELRQSLAMVLGNLRLWQTRAEAGREFVRRELNLQRRVDAFIDLYRELAPQLA